MAKLRVHLFIKGKVQGVFFRQAMKVTAKKNNATGWVKNLKDGRVEAIIEGEDLDVSNVVEWCHAGPANARVEDVEIRNEKFKGEFEKFEVLY
ncbi:MAG: acylphosphatase [Nitrososphaeria archaeon]|nr:acylphosphatase [Nitrososphaeria archaeon]NDB51697.1 acylphosphatase [Nitrosopumilaceae archaeon]NDB88851.1 acylphosphatase [Nitrososphaerota archaeon]NDB63840.1 acylphosphatase [Nitrosopumilaceae archaeon]NDB90717.1 acylphosphatase [Nitrososphaerota archaeon]